MRKRFVIVATVLAASACSLGKQTTPSPTGPSEFALSLAVTATPDVVPQDGQSQASIVVVARDASSQPVRGLSLRIDLLVGGAAVDYGTLVSHTISTGSDGRASVLYTAPPPPPATVNSDTLLTIQVTPIGGDYLGDTARFVTIRLTRPGVIQPPPTPPPAPTGPPSAAFTFSPISPVAGQSVQFNASASIPAQGRTIKSYGWDFGDGSASGSGLTTSHSYGYAGTYTVVLTVTDDVGNVGVKSLTVDVTAAGPTALFTYSPTNPFVNQAVQFNGSGSSASFGRTLVSYDWDFGDGTAHGSGVTSSHTYTAAKTYTVVLQVTDDLGHTGVMSATITVGFPGPTASFTVSPIDPAVGQPVQFNATASVASPGLTITSYEWDFGDGSAHTTSASATTSHAFTTANTFTVVLTVTDSVGNKSTTSKTVTVR